MKKWESFLNSRKGKVQAWLLILLVAVLAVVLVIGAKLIQKRNSEQEENQIEDNQAVETESSIELIGEPEFNSENYIQVLSGDMDGEYSDINEEELFASQIPYYELSGDAYEVHEETNTISFDPDLNITRFVLSDSPDGPTEDDVWHDVREEKEVEILDTEVKKKYVYYKAVSGSVTTASTIYTNSSTVTITGTAYGVRAVLFPTWSAVNGQDDLVWYPLEFSGGSWSTSIGLHNHAPGTQGVYYIHVYGVQNNSAGTQVALGGVTVYYDTTSPTGSVTSSTSVTTSAGTVTVTCNVSDNYGMSHVLFPTWSSSYGQDDIQWYRVNTSGGSVSYTVNLANHSPGKTPGETFNVHVYAYDAAGNEKFLGGVTIVYTEYYYLDLNRPLRWF